MERAIELSYNNLKGLETETLQGMITYLDGALQKKKIGAENHAVPSKAIQRILTERGLTIV